MNEIVPKALKREDRDFISRVFSVKEFPHLL